MNWSIDAKLIKNQSNVSERTVKFSFFVGSVRVVNHAKFISKV